MIGILLFVFKDMAIFGVLLMIPFHYIMLIYVLRKKPYIESFANILLNISEFTVLLATYC